MQYALVDKTFLLKPRMRDCFRLEQRLHKRSIVFAQQQVQRFKQSENQYQLMSTNNASQKNGSGHSPSSCEFPML
jgi:hypothetical protein